MLLFAWILLLGSYAGRNRRRGALTHTDTSDDRHIHVSN